MGNKDLVNDLYDKTFIFFLIQIIND
jgi:hypothetical protein